MVFICHMIVRNESLKNKNTFGFDISANIFFRIEKELQLNSLWKTNLLSQSSPLVLGGGSNILFTQNYAGLILFNQILERSVIKETDKEVYLRIGGGENWHAVVLWAVKMGWGGIENLSLIPGSMGAAPIQNIGAYGVEVEQVISRVNAFDMVLGKPVVFAHDECSFGYRDSIFKQAAKGRYFITSVEIKLQKSPQLHIEYGDIKQVLEQKGIQNPGIADVSKAVIEIRQSKLPDPKNLGNCGSFFKNPVVENDLFEAIKSNNPEIRSFAAKPGFTKIPAAWLIEKAGWKGFRRGDAGVHEKQALVLVNYGGAKGQEIYQLALDIQGSIKDQFGVQLEMEVNVR